MTSGQIPPQVQQQIEEGKQKLQQLSEENQKLKQDKSEKMAELQLDREIGFQKLQNERELKMMQIASDRDAKALENGGVEEIGQDGQPVVKSGTEVIMQGLSMLGQMIVQQGEANSAQLQQLAHIIAAPTELVRDPNTGRASGSRKVLQ